MKILNIGSTHHWFNHNNPEFTQVLVINEDDDVIAQFFGPLAKINAMKFVRMMTPNITKNSRRYIVYQDDKPANCHHYPEVDASWNNCIFDSFEEAAIYAIMWCYPFDKETAEVSYSQNSSMFVVNEPMNMSMCEIPVMMTIKEI